MEHSEMPQPALDAPDSGTRESQDSALAIEQHFARSIDFFGLGIAVLMPHPVPPSACADSTFLVAFQVTGDEQGFCAVAFNHLPATEDDKSMILELANILASKFVTQFADTTCSNIMISPPLHVAAGEQRHRYLNSLFLAAGPNDAIVRRYEYSGLPRASTRIHLAYLPSRKGGRT